MIRIQGLNELAQTLKAVAEKVPQQTKVITAKSGLDLQRRAKKDAPVDTGKLRQSINYESQDEGFTAVVTAGGAIAPYAPYVEFGTGGLVEVPDGWEGIAAEFKGEGKRTINLKPQPYLIPNWSVVSREYATELTKLIEKIR